MRALKRSACTSRITRLSPFLPLYPVLSEVLFIRHRMRHHPDLSEYVTKTSPFINPILPSAQSYKTYFLKLLQFLSCFFSLIVLTVFLLLVYICYLSLISSSSTCKHSHNTCNASVASSYSILIL